jgi:hypothetical protein
MNRKLLTLIALIICGTGLYLWWFSDTKVVTRSTHKLIECFEIDAGDGRIGGAITTSTFRDLLDDNISPRVERNDIGYITDLVSFFTKGDLVQLHVGLINSAATVKITDRNVTITDIEDEKALVNLSFHIITEKLTKNLDHDININLTYKKVDGDWKVTEAVLTK